MVAPSRRAPLNGLRVTDLSRVVAGPYGSYLLGRMGAEVTKIEDTDPIDTTRQFGPTSDGNRDLNRGGYFASLNGGKQSVNLHLSDPEQAQLAREIILAGEVVIENFPTGTMARLGLDYAALAHQSPSLVMVSATGFGQTGAMRRDRAYMNTVAAYIGLSATTGYAGGRQIPVGATYSDYVAGTCVAFAALLAVRTARATGVGRHIDLSMAEASMALMGEPFMEYFAGGRVAERRGNAFANGAPANVYRCLGDDKWIAITVRSDEQWARLVEVMGTPAWAKALELSVEAGRFAQRAAIDAQLSDWTARFSSLQLTERLQAAGIPAAPCSDPEDLVTNPHLNQRGAIAAQDFALEPGRLMPNLPWHFAGRPELDGSIPQPPGLGEHTAGILNDRTSASPELAAKIEAAAKSVTSPG